MKNQCKPVFRGKWMALLLSVLLLMGMLPVPGGMAEAGSLNVKLTADTYDHLPKEPAVEVTLYQIGTADGNAKSGWRIYDDFRGYGIIEAKTPSDLGRIAAKLEKDIVGKTQYKGTTKALSNGEARFSIDEYGVYFGMVTAAPKGLEVQPFIVTVPSRDPETKELRENYDVVLKDSCVTSVTVEKVWEDADDQDGKRPTFIDVTLSNGRKVTLNDANGWKATVDSLPIYEKGQEIAYTWTEAKVDGYTPTQVTNGKITTLTNTHTPEETEVTVKKVWNDADDQDALRPDHIDVTLSNGQTVTLNDANQWTATISNLPKYDKGQEIAYTWIEAKVDGYASTQVTDGTITTLTNIHKPEETEATVKKVWDDANDQDALRPDHIDVTLSNGQTVTLNDANQWTATVTGLPKYDKGKEITYTWTEAKVDGYMSTQVTEGTITTLTNVHKPEETEATVKKVWDDKDDQDALRPGSIEVTLSNGQTVTLSDSNNWTATITGLPKYDKGQEIAYTWTEAKVDGYTSTQVTDGTITTLTNVHKPEETEVTVKKVWDDANDQDHIRPNHIDVTLSNGQTVTLNDANQWTATITGLPKYDKGKEIAYTWTEAKVDGYTSTQVTEGAITTLTNSHTPETPPPATVDISGLKIWVDEGNIHNTRPASITVTLYGNGTPVNATPTWTNTNTDRWTFTFAGLPAEDADGKAITYTVKETPVEGYTSTVTGTSITNELIPKEPKEYKDLSGTKNWVEVDESTLLESVGERPEYITVRLFRNGVEVESMQVRATDNWKYTFKNQPMDDGYGNAYEYTIREDSVAGFYGRVDGMDLYNTTLSKPNRQNTTTRQVYTRITNTPVPKFAQMTAEEVDELMEMLNYNTPLWGQLLGTGDNTPVYPFVFGGVGLLAILALVIFGRKRKKEK